RCLRPVARQATPLQCQPTVQIPFSRTELDHDTHWRRESSDGIGGRCAALACATVRQAEGNSAYLRNSGGRRTARRTSTVDRAPPPVGHSQPSKSWSTLAAVRAE